MKLKHLLAVLAAVLPLTAQAVDAKDPRVSLISSKAATTTTGASVSLSGKPHRVVAEGITVATVTVYGTNVYCGTSCEAADGTSLGTITTDGGTLDINKATAYLYGFALMTAWTSGTVNASISPLEQSGAGSSSSSPAYSTLVTPNGDPAMDDTANAVKEVGTNTSGSLSDDGDVDALEAIGTITTSFNYSTCSVVFTTTVTLTAFQVLLSNDAGSTYSIIAGGASGTTSADYTSPYGHVHSTSGDLTTAASGSTHRIQLDGLLPWNRVQFKAASTNADTTATYACVYGPGR